MNINYAAIIDTAKVRADRIRQFEEAAKLLPMISSRLEIAISDMQKVATTWDALDVEAQNMFPKEVGRALQYFRNTEPERNHAGTTCGLYGASNIYRMLEEM